MKMRRIEVGSRSYSEAVLPDQFFRAAAKSPQAEHRLLLAVLVDAVESFQKLIASDVSRDRGILAETEGWLFGVSDKVDRPPRDGDGFSFEEVCEVLGLCPDYVRMGLLRWREQVLATRGLDTRQGAPSLRRGTREAALPSRSPGLANRFLSGAHRGIRYVPVPSTGGLRHPAQSRASGAR